MNIAYIYELGDTDPLFIPHIIKPHPPATYENLYQKIIKGSTATSHNKAHTHNSSQSAHTTAQKEIIAITTHTNHHNQRIPQLITQIITISVYQSSYKKSSQDHHTHNASRPPTYQSSYTNSSPPLHTDNHKHQVITHTHKNPSN